MSAKLPDEKRRYYRLQYPKPERPTVWFQGCCYVVSEISEGGVRVILAGACAVRLGQSFAGILRFKDGGTVPIVGVVIRLDHDEIVVKLSKGISLKCMIAEQSRVRKKYPMFFDRAEK
jgi:hypothetical protein